MRDRDTVIRVPHEAKVSPEGPDEDVDESSARLGVNAGGRRDLTLFFDLRGRRATRIARGRLSPPEAANSRRGG